MALVFDESTLRQELESGKSLNEIVSNFQKTMEQVYSNIEAEAKAKADAEAAAQKEADEKTLDECCQKIADATNVAVEILVKGYPDYVRDAAKHCKISGKEVKGYIKNISSGLRLTLGTSITPVGIEDCKQATKSDDEILRDFFGLLK